MNPAQEAYDRLMAARRILSPEELAEIEKSDTRNSLAHRIRRRLQKVY